MAGENEKKCDCPEDDQRLPYSKALDVLRKAHLNLMRELWNAEHSALWMSASMHAVHAGMFNAEREFIETAERSRVAVLAPQERKRRK
jgi:hypothetical protein